MSYIESELEALEREQESIDLKASALEKKLRSVMGGIIDSKFKDSFARSFTNSNPCSIFQIPTKRKRKNSYCRNGSL